MSVNALAMIARLVVVALLIFFINATFNLRSENKALRLEINTISEQFEMYKRDVQVRLNAMNGLYEERRLAQQEFAKKLSDLKTHAKREDVIVSKPGLSAIKINKSFKTFADSLSEVSK